MPKSKTSDYLVRRILTDFF
uniref:Uncharacterized protein n=1 Tax=Arundo donax TaxID=35708 RepID=A0A0A9HLP4_ARUDO